MKEVHFQQVSDILQRRMTNLEAGIEMLQSFREVIGTNAGPDRFKYFKSIRTFEEECASQERYFAVCAKVDEITLPYLRTAVARTKEVLAKIDQTIELTEPRVGQGFMDLSTSQRKQIRSRLNELGVLSERTVWRILADDGVRSSRVVSALRQMGVSEDIINSISPSRRKI